MEFDIDAVERLTRIAFEFGPFLFAIVGLFIVTRIAYGYLEKAQKRADQLGRSTSLIHKSIYASSWLFAFILVGVSVYWWIGNRPEQNIYRFMVIDLSEKEFVTASDEHTFSRSVSIGQNHIKNVEFAVVSREPLKEISPFRLKYFNDELTSVTPFEIPYDPEKRKRKFKIKDGVMTVADGRKEGIGRLFSLITTAIADQPDGVISQASDDPTKSWQERFFSRKKEYRYVYPTGGNSTVSEEKTRCCLPSTEENTNDIVGDPQTERYVPSDVEMYQMRQQIESIER